jgi:hypothetical protein
MKGNCSACATAIHVPLDDKVSAGNAPASPTRAWWRPKVDEDPGPPSCYRCGGLAKRICRNCENLYCGEHAGRSDLCDSCARSSWMALWIMLGVLIVILALVALPLLMDRLR